jgi:hypothetical protein
MTEEKQIKSIYMKLKLSITLVIIVVLMSSCLSLFDNQTEQYLLGEWQAVSIQNETTGNSVDINPNGSNYILGNKQGDAIYFSSDGNFTVYNQKTGLTSSTQVSGTYDLNVLTLHLLFRNPPEITREIQSISELEMIMRDTIFGSPVLIAYNKL